ncbi:MAG: flagellar biosynthetic protein FliR [Steroidobacteraceae bacterium]|nr:flagellar biosynthetic protein FliR [Steroidobacteraceae bacterium]
MQPINLNASDIAAWAVRLWWPMLRIGGFVATAPLISATAVPARVKIALTLAIGFLLAPSVQVPAGLSIFSATGVLAAGQEMMIGLAIGTVVQIGFEALSFAGQIIAMTMGLSFATLIDPQRGANSPALGQLFVIFATLLYLALDGHLLLLGELANSYRSLPIGAAHLDGRLGLAVAQWGGSIFETGLLIALPAVISLIIVNFALGVVTRAAPQLNLFGVGFPLTLLAGFVVLIVGMNGTLAASNRVIQSALAAVAELTAAPVPRVP